MKTQNRFAYYILIALAAIIVFSFTSCSGNKTVPGKNLAEKLAWLQTNAQSNGSYLIELKGDENSVFQTLSYKDKSNITITIKGIDSNRTVNLSTNGSLFNVRYGVTLVLDNNITLQGRNGNTDALISVDSGGVFKMCTGSTITGNSYGVHVGVGVFDMNGGIISNNTGYEGKNLRIGGVYVNGGSFSMTGGTISGNTHGGVDVRNGIFTMSDGNITGNKIAGGVYVGAKGNFTMSGGNISGNTTENGGGVGINDGGAFTMNGGTISANAAKSGGGVDVSGGGAFTMNGGTISGNAGNSSGGGVALKGRSSFTMNEGIITDNTANSGGGVYVHWGSTFTMNAGTISGNTASSNGGGVLMVEGNIAMSGGIITNNIANSSGGGVWINSGNFTKTSGTITGYNSDLNDGNVVRNESGNVQNNKGHSICIYDSYASSKYKETSAGPEINLSYIKGTISGDWDK